MLFPRVVSLGSYYSGALSKYGKKSGGSEKNCDGIPPALHLKLHFLNTVNLFLKELASLK